MSGIAYEITTTRTEFRVYLWIKSRANMDAIGHVIGRRVTRKDFDNQPLIVTREA